MRRRKRRRKSWPRGGREGRGVERQEKAKIIRKTERGKAGGEDEREDEEEREEKRR